MKGGDEVLRTEEGAGAAAGTFYDRLDALERTVRGGEVRGRTALRRAAVVALGMVLLVTWGFLGETTPLLRALIASACVAGAFVLVVIASPGVSRRFGGGTAPPIDLAVLRIAVFTTLLSYEAVREANFFSQLSEALVVPPTGLAPVAAYATNPALVRILAVGFVVASIAAIVGWHTRPAAATAVILGVLVLGVPQFFGKVNHQHHLIWFGAVLAASRCGDALSIDAFRAARRRGQAGAVSPPAPSRAYGLPLRFCWLLLGIVYFFPGFWKFVTVGPRWALGDNLRQQMVNKWAELGGWTPIFPVHEYPFLYRSAGVFTLVFELFFIVLVFTPLLRRVAVAIGLAFHNGTAALMGIPFWSLQVMYVGLIPWGRVLRWSGERTFAAPLVVEFEGRDPGQRRGVAVLAAFDVLGGLEFRDVGSAPDAQGWLGGLCVPAVDGAVPATGYAAWRRAVGRTPPLWPLRLLGRRATRWLLRAPAREARSTSPRRLASQLLTVTVVGGVLVAATTLAGVARIGNGWPIAVYPTFAYESLPERTELQLELEREDGAVDVLARPELARVMRPERLTPVVLSIVDAERPAVLEARLDGLLGAMELRGMPMDDVAEVRVRRLRISTAPDATEGELLDSELLRTITLSDR